MDNRKTLLELFKRYDPPAEYKKILQSAINIATRVERDKKMLEVDAEFTSLVEKTTLFHIEEQVREAHQINSVRIFPKYPADLFSQSYIPQILLETQRTGTVSRGFFNDYNIEVDEDDKMIIVEVYFPEGGVILLCDAKTPDVISDLIFSEFGIRYTVEIRRVEGYIIDHSVFEKQQQEQIDQLIQEMADNAPPEPEEIAKEVRPELAPSIYNSEVTFEPVTDNIYKIGFITFNIENSELIYGNEFTIAPTPLREITKERRGVVALGEIFLFDKKLNKSGEKTTVTFSITDEDMSISVKCIKANDDVAPLLKNLKVGKVVAVKGNVKSDQYNDGELYIDLTDLALVEKIDRVDEAEKKRVELHLHTNLSAMDGTIKIDKLLNTAKRWGHKAIAVTDHGNVQAFPEIMEEKEKMKLDMKIIYGMEAYFVDDTARVVYGKTNTAFDGEFIVFDIETTGLSVLQDKITEIGAVLISNGEIVDRFHTYVDPEIPISAEITKLTGIDDMTVAGAPLTESAVRAFLDFADNRILIAHNAGFDVGFIRKAADDHKIYFNNSYLDTLALSRYLNPKLKSHRLNVVAEHYGFGGFNHHRATDDAEVLAKIFLAMTEILKTEGVKDTDSVTISMSEKVDPLKLPTYHMIILVQNLTGLKNLYKLVSKSYLEYYYRHPRIPKTILNEYREGLIIGSACESGELFCAIRENKAPSDILEIAEYYDYLEIQPLCNNQFLINDGKAGSVEDLKNFNRKIVQLGEELNKPVVATCDAHFINKQDEIARKILMSGMKFSDADRDIGLYLRTTEEMLAEFDYLGDEKAYETVVTNTNLVADMIEDIRPIPKGTYTPYIDGADKDLQELCYNRAKKMYGDPLPDVVAKRLEKEMTSIISNGFAVLYVIAVKLVEYSESQGYLVGSRGSVGSSFVAAMAGISEVNPLPPHYWCENCQNSDFEIDKKYGSGFDLPPKMCPKCGKLLKQDGHDIPFETFLGFYGEKSPDIDLNFSGDVQAKVHKYTEQLFGSENVFRAGTLGTLASKTAFGFVAKYLESKGIWLNKAEINRLVDNCVGVKRTTGQHPGGIIVVPNDKEIYDFTPVQHPADDVSSDVITTHFAFSYLHDTILKLDELGHDVPTKYKKIEEYSGVKIDEIPMNDAAVYELFKSTRSLKVSSADIDCQLGTFGLPEMGTRFIQQVLLEAKPQNFADLLQISGLTHGTDVWLGNAQDLIKNGTCTISEVVGTRDNIMLYLINKGLENDISFKITEDVRKGKGLTTEFEEAMRANDVPDWYIGSCKKIKYMFPKAHAAAYVMAALRLGWYKIYKPLEFYAGFFTVAPGGFDAEIVMQGKHFVMNKIKEIERKGNEATQKESEMVSTLQLVNEFYARGFKFLPVALYKSDSHAFIIEDGKVRMPYISLSGLGEIAALKITEVCREEELMSIEDLRHRAKLSKTVIEILQKNKVLDGMSETNQISIFDF